MFPSLKTVTLAITFALSLFKSSVPDITQHIKDKYGPNLLKVYRKLLTDTRKLEKSKLDLIFLSKCKTYDVVPKFLRFKLYRKALQSGQFYKSWQVKLLDFEMSQKTSQSHKLSANILEIKSIIQSKFTVFESYLINRTVTKIIKEETEETSRTHESFDGK